jgi:lipopolysaccharide export system permease protein
LAVAVAVIAVVGLRIAGFAASGAVVRTPLAIVAVWGAPLAAITIALLFILQGQRMLALTARIGDLVSGALAPLLPRLRRS